MIITELAARHDKHSTPKKAIFASTGVQFLAASLMKLTYLLLLIAS
jgi:hypothetical protein